MPDDALPQDVPPASSLALWVRALRLPFLSVSVAPYLYGSALAGEAVEWPVFLLGLIAVGATHLSANLANDLADDASGGDARDPTYYGFFGGSKLLQEGRLSRRAYARAAQLFAGLAFASVLILTGLQQRPELLLFLAAVLLLAWSYSKPPLRLMARGGGEATIFLLFGPATVLGAVWLHAPELINPKAVTLSLPFGFLAAAVLLVNEVPDADDDARTGKRTLVVRLGAGQGYRLFWFVIGLCDGVLLLAWMEKWIGYIGLAAPLLTMPLVLRAGRILKRHVGDKAALLPASRHAVLLHTLASVLLLADILATSFLAR